MTRPRILLLTAVTLGLVAIAAVALAWQARVRDAALLRADPDNLPPAIAAHARDAGAGIFSDHCAGCHGADARGNRILGIPDLTDHDWLYGTGQVSEIAQTVRYGIRSGDPRGRDLADMPAFAHPVPYTREKLLPLAPNDVQDVAAFLLRQGGRPADTAAAERGAKIFKTRGGCWDCHGEDGRGDNAVGAPDLIDRIWLYGDGSPEAIFRSIADGHRGTCPAFVNTLSAAQIIDVAVYVRSREGMGQ